MYRAIVEAGGEGVVKLPADEAHHLVRVRRARPGSRFLGLTDEGRWLLCELDRIGRTWVGRVLEEIVESRESPLQIVLAQSLIKKDKFEWVIQKCVELGVAEIIPIITRRTEVRPEERGAARRMQRWRKIMVEAVKQCGRSRVPALHQPTGLGDLVAIGPGPVLVLDEQGGIPLRLALAKCGGAFGDRRVTVLVGPEGGWDNADREAFSRLNTVSIHLGPRILRAETAPVAVLSILQYELGDMGANEK